MMGMSNLPPKKNGGKIILGTLQSTKKEINKKNYSTNEEMIRDFKSSSRLTQNNELIRMASSTFNKNVSESN